MNLPKQDRNGARTPSDLERKYKLGKTNTKVITIERKVNGIEKRTKIDTELSETSNNAVQNNVITMALGNKVDKEDGKQLSSNDFTDKDKKAIHIHDNKELLDEITKESIDGWNLIFNFLNLIAFPYNKDLTYKVGDYVIYNGNLYKCKTAITVIEEWNENYWTKTTVMAEIINRKEE